MYSRRKTLKDVGKCSHGCVPTIEDTEKAVMCKGSSICGCETYE